MVKLILILIGGAGALGCGETGPKLGAVKGIVTLDGKPADEMLVTYEPQIPKGAKVQGSKVGGASSGITNDDGEFELTYRDGKRKGAVVGPHLVRIESAKGGGPAGGDSAESQIYIPARYNLKSVLTAEVKEGKNEPQKFELTSKPDSDKKQLPAK